jgi:hypothetical protein
VGAHARPGGHDHDRGNGHRHFDERLVGYFIQWGIYGQGYFVKNVLTSGDDAEGSLVKSLSGALR